MKNMNPIFSLKNFRSFGEEGADFELAPITVLTGCNSAGKSSLVKALMLMTRRSFDKQPYGLSQVDRLFPDLKLKTSSVALKLGGFSNVIHMQDISKEIVISYEIWSKYLHENIICNWHYKVNKGVLADGKLQRLSVFNGNGDVLFEGKPSITLIENLYGEIEHEQFEWPDELPETIEDNYHRFLAVYEYLYFKILDDRRQEVSLQREKLKEKNPEIQIQSDSSFTKRIKERKESGLKQLIESDLSQGQAEEYDHDAILNWHQINNKLLNELDKVIIDELSEDEKNVKKEDTYFTCVINEILSPSFINSLSFIDSSTNKISRVYNVEDKDKLSAILCEIVNRKSNYKYITGDFVNSWLVQFNIGEQIEIEAADEGLGVKVYIKNKGVRQLMADEGYGITQLVSLLLQIDMIRESHGYHEVDSNFKECLNYYQSTICVEEPEVHLHPKYQSLLAEMFVEAYQKYNIHFIIETHSEYLIRKLQVMVADKENAFSPNDVSLNYVEKDENGVSTNRKIEIQEDGGLSDSFGSGFYDEADSLALDLFRKKPILS